MILYNGGPVDWFYDGLMTEDEMRADERYSKLFSAPCVLYDNGLGKAYDFDTLEHVCAKMAVPYSGAAVEQSWQCVLASLDGTYNAQGVDQVYDIAYAAKNTANEAKQIAEQAGTDPQLAALATMQVATMDLTEAKSTDCVGFRDYWPEWKPDTEYKYQQPIRHKGLYYRASKALTSSSVYPPDTAGESEYYPVEVAPDGVIVYRECHGQYDQVQAGETRHYPDAEGPVYRAKVDTAYDPDTVPGNWELVDGEPTEPDEGETTTEPEEPSDEPTEPTIPVFVQPTGAHDAYGIGDRVTYNGKVYESTMAGNVYSPDAYPQGWKLVE